MKLRNDVLDGLPDSIDRPRYDRAALSAGIVHIGLGNFHRAHQAWYLHRLMQSGKAKDWAIIGAGVREGDAHMRAKLLAQDCLTTLIELDPQGTSGEVIGSMIDFIPIETNNASLIAKMSDPAIRIVSLTVTEGGYFLDSSGALDVNHEDIKHDASNPENPRTAFGSMVAALKTRRDAGISPFTGLCCDNLQDNGTILRQTVVGVARLSDPELANWIDSNVTFPNSMVDCIVPATGEAELKLAKNLGIDDAAPVTHENFRQWVIEDKFVNGRPEWEEVGATITDNVHPYESMKIRMLNAGHQVLANLGELLSVPTISGCMENKTINGFFHKVESEEIVPHVDAVPNLSPEAYLELIEKRFSNPEILDTTRRVAFDGSSRHPGFLLPILRDALAAGGAIDGLALTEALWARMCAGIREDGSKIDPNDPHWDDLQATALSAKEDPNMWLGQKSIYGDLATNDIFAKTFGFWLRKLWSEGSDTTVRDYIDGTTA